MDPDKTPRQKRVHRAKDFEAPPEELTHELDPDGEWHGSRSRDEEEEQSASPWWLILLALAALPLAFVLPEGGARALLAPRAPADSTLVSDIHLSDLSQALSAQGDRLQIASAWRRGQIATWDETIELGAPLSASTDAGAFFLPHVIWRFLGPETSAPWLAGLSILLLGLGMVRFLMRRGLDSTAALVGGVGLQAAGFFAANLHAPWRVWSVLFLPWMLLGIEKIHARERSGVWIALVASALSFYAGAPRYAFLAWVLAIVWALVRGLRDFLAKEQVEGAARSLALSIAALLCGIGLAGPQLWPELEAFSRSARLAIEPAQFDALAIQTGQDLLSFILPRGGLAGGVDGRLYLGAPLLALALAGLIGATRRALFPLITAAFALCMLGAVEPFPSILRGLPGGDQLLPRDALSLFSVSMCWLAALGADACLQRLRRPWFVLFLSLGVVTFGCLIMSSRVEGEAESAARSLASWTGAAVCLFTFARVMVTRETIAARRLPWILILALLAGGGVELVKARSPHREALEPRASEIAAFLNSSNPSRGATWIEIARTEEMGRTLSAESFAGFARSKGWRHLSARRPYPNAELHRMFAELGSMAVQSETWTGSRPRVLLKDEAFLNRGLFDLMQVELAHSTETLGEVSGMTKVAESTSSVLSNRKAQEPFVRLAPSRVIRTPDAASLRKMVSLVIVSGSPSTPLHAEPGLGKSDSARDQMAASFSPAESKIGGNSEGSQLDAQVEGGSGGRLVFREAFAPGWKATINGEDVAVSPADALFRQLDPVPPDRESAGLIVRTKYEPWSMRYGAALALFSLLLGAFVARRA